MTLLEHAISYTDELVKVLEAKNKSYGNSVEEPIRIFSRADPETALRVRIDDKLSRIARGEENAFNEDTHLDLVGYLLLLGGLKRKQGQKLSQESVNKLIDKAIEEMEATPKQLLCLIANPAGFRCDHGLGHKGHHRNSVARVNFQSPDDLGWYGAWDSRRPSNGKEPLSDSRRPAESE